MKKKWEERYFVTAVVSVPIYKGFSKTEAYRQAAKDGWGTVYRDENGDLVCDEDCCADLYTKNGGYFGIRPYEEINTKEMPKQAECAAIITGDSCGLSFWAEDFSKIHIFVKGGRMNIFVLLAVAAVGGLLGFLAAALFYAYHATRRKSRKGAGRKKVEFIKLVLMLVMATYFLGVAVGVKIVLEHPEELGTLLTYIGAPTATVIIFYAWKAKAENVIKIKKNNPEIMDSVSEIGNL